MRPTLLLTVFSLAVLGCASKVPLPDADLCQVNVPALHEKCYNASKDYDENGYLKKGAQPKIKQYQSRDQMLDALSKNTSMDPDSWARVKAYIKDLRKEWNDLQNQLSQCPSQSWGG